MTEPICITNNPPDYATLVREAVDADEAVFSPGALRGIKYAILAVAQAIRDASAAHVTVENSATIDTSTIGKKREAA